MGWRGGGVAGGEGGIKDKVHVLKESAKMHWPVIFS